MVATAARAAVGRAGVDAARVIESTTLASGLRVVTEPMPDARSVCSGAWVGVGPFLTIPFMVTAMDGPHVLYAWIAGAILALADGLVYAQLGAALPESGGGYVYLKEAFEPFRLGRLMGFLFIFQTVLIAPLSVLTGLIRSLGL